MDCRDFRDRHAPFVDVLCSAHEEAEMRQHMLACASCARHDMLVRRSLMLVKSLPAVELSPDFHARLETRLRAARLQGTTPAPMRLSYVTFAALAAAVAFVAFLGVSVSRRAAPTTIRMAPVVATLPEIESSPLTASALAAAVPTGMSVWPAIMVASEAPIQFVAAELASER